MPQLLITDTVFFESRGWLGLLFTQPDPPVHVEPGAELELISPDGEKTRTSVNEVHTVLEQPWAPNKFVMWVSLPGEDAVRLRNAKARIATN